MEKPPGVSYRRSKTITQFSIQGCNCQKLRRPEEYDNPFFTTRFLAGCCGGYRQRWTRFDRLGVTRIFSRHGWPSRP
jgi:hypothetical protein